MAYQHGGGAASAPRCWRDPEAVKDDVLDENVSLDAARSNMASS